MGTVFQITSCAILDTMPVISRSILIQNMLGASRNPLLISYEVNKDTPEKMHYYIYSLE